MNELTKEERHELCKILKRYISSSSYEPFMKEGLLAEGCIQ